MEDFWYHNKSVSAPISLSQCGYESYHPNSSIRNYIVQQNGYFIMFYLVRILRSRSSTF